MFENVLIILQKYFVGQRMKDFVGRFSSNESNLKLTYYFHRCFFRDILLRLSIIISEYVSCVIKIRSCDTISNEIKDTKYWPN